MPLSAFTHIEQTHRAAGDQPSGAVPGRHDSRSTWRPARRWATRSTPIEAGHRTSWACRPASSGSFQGTAQAFQASLANEPLLILAALVTVYIVLGVLYESYIHPITILSTLPSAGVGALLALMLCRTDLSVIALIGIILLIGIVKKNAIMMIDFALEAERKEGKTPDEAIYQACLLRFRPIMMTTMAALLGARAAGPRHGHGLGAAPAAGHRDRRRPALQPGAHALHHAGDLPGLRPAGAALGRTPRPARRSADEPAPEADMNISTPFIQRPVATTLLTVGVALAGVLAFSFLPVSPLPQVDFPTISVCGRAARGRARRPWPPRWPRRWSGSSGASRASPR